jgi:hypothetical protein
MDAGCEVGREVLGRQARSWRIQAPELCLIAEAAERGRW